MYVVFLDLKKKKILVIFKEFNKRNHYRGVIV